MLSVAGAAPPQALYDPTASCFSRGCCSTGIMLVVNGAADGKPAKIFFVYAKWNIISLLSRDNLFPLLFFHPSIHWYHYFFAISRESQA